MTTSSATGRFIRIIVDFSRAMSLSAVLMLSLVIISGCSISASSNSISDSISSPFKWSSDSSDSSSGGKEEAYLDDVRDYTVVFLQSSDDLEAFRSGLAALAARHGVTDWESDQATSRGIGEGLGKARVGDIRARSFITGLSGGDAARAAAIRKGYETYQKTV